MIKMNSRRSTFCQTSCEGLPLSVTVRKKKRMPNKFLLKKICSNIKMSRMAVLIRENGFRKKRLI